MTAGPQPAIAFLERPESYGCGASRLERIDTHAAVIFLVDDRAYKLKRAVHFSYLDFSTIQRREAACRAEVRLNRRTAAELYLGVRAVTRELGGTLAFDGAGEVLDWVVIMRRFDQELLFDRMAAHGALTESLMEALSGEIARFHAAAEPAPRRGGRPALERVIAGHAENFALAPHGMLSPSLCTSLVARWRALLEQCGELLDRRAAAGKVRHCHGDLHLRNICLWAGRPTLFDCIEFGNEYACIDVLYDLAFLLMDLEHRALRRYANSLLNAYLDRNDESDGLAALPLMLSLRAGVRAHTGAVAAATQSHPERRAAMTEEARQYLSLAGRLLEAQPPRLVALGGLSGSGKSTLARALAPEIGQPPGARLLHTDVVRKRLYGVAKTERLGPEAYAPAVSERVYRLQREAASAVLRARSSVVADGVFARPEERAGIAAVARECGARFQGFWLTAPERVLCERVRARTGDMSDAGVEVLAQQRGIETGDIAWTKISAGGSEREVLALAQAALRGERSRPHAGRRCRTDP